MRINEVFAKLSKRISDWMGHPFVFTFMFFLTITWIVVGIIRWNFGSDYQMYLNTFSSISTMLVAFLIANTQNRDTKALQLKLDQLLRCSCNPDSISLISLENRTDEEIENLAEEFRRLYKQSRLSKRAIKQLAAIID